MERISDAHPSRRELPPDAMEERRRRDGRDRRVSGGAGLDDFDWRISMARVEAGGPFSAFPGVDRTLSILEGEGIVLDIEGRERVTLTGASAPYSFPADAVTNAELVAGPITDLNVMTRRGRYRHKVCEHQVATGSMQLRLCRRPGAADLPVGELLVDPWRAAGKAWPFRHGHTGWRRRTSDRGQGAVLPDRTRPAGLILNRPARARPTSGSNRPLMWDWIGPCSRPESGSTSLPAAR